MNPSRRRRPAPLQHPHREHSGRGETGGGVLQDEERECSPGRHSSGHRSPLPLTPTTPPLLLGPCLGIYRRCVALRRAWESSSLAGPACRLGQENLWDDGLPGVPGVQGPSVKGRQGQALGPCGISLKCFILI